MLLLFTGSSYGGWQQSRSGAAFEGSLRGMRESLSVSVPTVDRVPLPTNSPREEKL
jgi:hypothetical protein